MAGSVATASPVSLCDGPGRYFGAVRPPGGQSGLDAPPGAEYIGGRFVAYPAWTTEDLRMRTAGETRGYAATRPDAPGAEGESVTLAGGVETLRQKDRGLTGLWRVPGAFAVSGVEFQREGWLRPAPGHPRGIPRLAFSGTGWAISQVIGQRRLARRAGLPSFFFGLA